MVFDKHGKSCYNNLTTEKGERRDVVLKKDTCR